MLSFLWLLFLVCSPAGTIHRAHASRSQGKHIILLAGQSNMSGRGGITNSTWNRIIPPECRPKASILRLSENLTWVVAQDPLHQDIDVNTTCGIGPGMPFARRLLEINPKLSPVGLVPCAVGGRQGTKISEWARGTFLYNQLVRRARAARQGGGRILGILWYQGESDSVSEEDANSYKVRLEKFFVDLRASLGSPMLPIIQVALASGQGPYTETVRQAQLGLKLGNVRCVDAKGLQLQPDHLHLSTPAQVRLGKLLAEAFLKTKPKTITVQTGGGP